MLSITKPFLIGEGCWGFKVLIHVLIKRIELSLLTGDTNECRILNLPPYAKQFLEYRIKRMTRDND